MEFFSLADLSNAELIHRTKQTADRERWTTAELVALLAEVDRRRIYEGEGCSSLFAYCTEVLHYSEHAAYGRIEAARLSQQFPIVIAMLAAGAVNLTTVGLLAPHLTDENCDVLLDAIRHKSKREVERLVAGIHPAPDIPALIRKVPAAPRPSEPRPAAMTLEKTAIGFISVHAEPSEPADPPATRPAILAPIAPER